MSTGPRFVHRIPPSEVVERLHMSVFKRIGGIEPSRKTGSNFARTSTRPKLAEVLLAQTRSISARTRAAGLSRNATGVT
eukprot:11188576-Lingulodinium_polyedra.AAC.1